MLAVATILSVFFSRTDYVAVQAPWGQPCPARIGDLEAAVLAHLSAGAPPVAAELVTSRGSTDITARHRLGVYQVAADNTVRWACLDIDGGADHAHAVADPDAVAREVVARGAQLGLRVALERSGGGAGWHAWIFFSTTTSAAAARAVAMRLVPPDVLLSTGGVADAHQNRGIEVFPKQTKHKRNKGKSTTSGLGNFLWLPFWYGAAPGGNLFYDLGPEGTFVPRDVTDLPSVDPSAFVVDAQKQSEVTPEAEPAVVSRCGPVALAQLQRAPEAAAGNYEQRRSGSEYGAAIVNCARAYTDSSRWKGHDDGWSFPAWWRNGDDPRVRVWVESGTWHDIVTGTGGGAKRFAEVALGTDLGTFMDTYGDVHVEPVKTISVTPKTGLAWSDGQVAAAWEGLLTAALGPCGRCAGCIEDEACVRRRHDHGRRWLVDVRRLPERALLDAGGVGVDEKIARRGRGPLAQILQRWTTREGAGLVVPIRSAATNVVESLAFRPYRPQGDRKTFFLAGAKLKDQDGAPRGYGLMGGLDTAAVVVVTEGMVDAVIAAEGLRATTSAVVGAVSAGDLRSRWSWLAGRIRGRVVVVPDLDGGHVAAGTGQDAAVELVGRLRVAGHEDAGIFKWQRVIDLLLREGLDVTDIRDLGDMSQVLRGRGDAHLMTRALLVGIGGVQ
jgi:hypothetical protein